MEQERSTIGLQGEVECATDCLIDSKQLDAGALAGTPPASPCTAGIQKLIFMVAMAVVVIRR
jgi:hypothetical protein